MFNLLAPPGGQLAGIFLRLKGMRSADDGFESADGKYTLVITQALLEHLKGNVVQVMDTVVESVGAAFAGHATAHVESLETGPGQARFFHALQKTPGIGTFNNDLGDQLLVFGTNAGSFEMFNDDFAHSPVNAQAVPPAKKRVFLSIIQ